MKLKKLFGCIATIAYMSNAGAAVTVHINSGNPAYPFPQFLEYACGGNLGTRNAEGVVHAELEQDIRDAYQIHANEFAYSGDSWAGIKYIETPYKAAYDCTEGDGYGLLACAYMADKVTFDGYWMCTHDKRRNKTKKYKDCTETGAGYAYGDYAISDDAGGGGNTAADGDVDVALALYVAYKQWGEFMLDDKGNKVLDACGNPISYKQEMINVIRGLVAMSTRFPTENPRRVNTGLIGLDGYPKGGDTWNEQTKWASQEANFITLDDGAKAYPEFGSGVDQHIDYNAPAYFREFHDLLISLGAELGATNEWEAEQFRRAEASSDWLIGQLIGKNEHSIPTAGWCTVSDDGSETSFSNFNMGEDYRCSWRTICNYMWHGNPSYSWNAATHKVTSGGNTYEYDAAVKFSKFLNDPAHWNEAEGSACIEYGDPKNLPYSGPSTICWQYDPMTGVTLSDFYVLNCQNGTGSYSAVGAQDYDLMGLLYRQCAIEWDNNGTAGEGDCYLGTKPVYMHGWARQMGMMVLSGNYPAPSAMEPTANMKIYRGIKDSITYCYTGDSITFLLDYRNYGSIDAKSVKIVENVPEDFVFVSASDGGVYNAASHTVTWNIGTVAGFKSDDVEGPALDVTAPNFSRTIGQVYYTCKAGPNASGRYCTTADITCSNGSGWTTNEYPNYKTPTMQRNCVDVVKRSLIIEKSADREKINTDNIATFTIKFENSSEAGWIDGGRPRVNVSYSSEDQGNQYLMRFRLFDDAIEPYINYGNYRISYYLYDAGLNCLAGEGDCTTGWQVKNQIYEGGTSIGNADGVKVTQENIVEGQDSYGKWNQRICVQFAPLLVTTTMHLARYFGGANCRIHKGGTSPLRGVWSINASNWKNPDWSTHWSYGNYDDKEGGLYYPITPSWQKLDEKGKSIEEPVNKWLTCGCTTSDKTVPNILVEEYDGYVWRRILGTGPMAGRDVDSVYVRDTLPVGMKFVEFIGSVPLEEENGATLKHYTTKDGRDVIEWFSPKMQVKQKGTITYTANITFPSGNECMTDDETIINTAWISAVKNSPVSDTASIIVTCSKVPEPIKPSTLTKVADKETYSVGDDISYTIGYKQTHGAQFDNAESTPADWTLDKWSISGGQLSSGSNSVGSAIYTKSMSKNGYMEFTCTPSTYQWFTILMRKSSNSSIRIVLHTIDATSMGVFVYDGTTLVSEQPELIYSKGLPFTMRLDLNEDYLRVWVNKDTTASPNFSCEGLTVNEGYMGFQNGDATGGNTSGVHTLSNINVHTDYAYDLGIVDRIPAEVDYVSAECYHNGSLAGTCKHYTGTDQDSVVCTGLADNPIAFGDTFTVILNGTVNACEESIINVAYATLLGHATNEIMAQAVSGCGESKCVLEKVTVETDAETICETDSTIIRATATPKGTYYYQFYQDGKPYGKISKADSAVINLAGKYYVKAFATNDTTDECFVKSTAISLAVDTIPATILADTSACAGGSIKLAATETAERAFTYLWSDGSTSNTLTVNEDGTYTVDVTYGECVAHDTATVTFGSVTLKDGIFTLGDVQYDRATYNEAPICPNVEGKLSVNYKADDDEFTWTSEPKDASMVADGNTVTISPTVDTKYYVSFKQGCDAIDSFTVTLGKPMEIEVTKKPLCNSVQITATTEDSKNPVFHWSLDGQALESTEAYIVLNEDYSKGTVGVYATATDGCTSETQEIEFQNNAMTAVIDGSPSVCPGLTTTLKMIATSTGLDETPTYTYAWLDDTKNAIAGETAESVTVGAGTYYGVVSNGLCTDTIKHEILEGSGEHVGTFSVNDSILYGSPKTFGSCGEALKIVADYTHDEGTDFAWEVNGVAQSTTTNTLDIAEVTADMVVTLKWTNQCAAYDTLNITLQQDVEFTADSTSNKECGATTVKLAGATGVNTHFYWNTSAGTTYEGGNYVADLETYPNAKGSAEVTIKANGFCDVTKEIGFSIDTLGVTLTADETVCYGTTPNVMATGSSSNSGATISYSYSYRKAGSTSKFIDLTPAEMVALTLTEDIELQVTASDGICTATDVKTIKIGIPERDGKLTIDGNEITEKDANGTKVYRTCGGEALALAVSHTSTLNDYTWTVNTGTAATAAGDGASISVTPSTTDGKYVGQYIVTYTNNCPATDTINIEVYPLSVKADWISGGFTDDHCSGTSTSATLILSGYEAHSEGSYIHWKKDGVQLASHDNKTELVLNDLQTEDAGYYSFEVSNGICVRPSDAESADNIAELAVKASTNLTATTNYVVTNGDDAELVATATPTDATITWYEVAADGTFSTISNPLTNVTRDYNLAVVSSGTDYCSDTVYATLLSDAKAIVNLSVSAPALCEGARDTLIADTTGTGHLLYPEKYSIMYFVLGEDGEYHSIEGVGFKVSIKPTITASYKARVNYGTQTVWSEPVEVTVYNHAYYDMDYDGTVCSGVESPIEILNLKPSDAAVSWDASESLTGDGTSVTVAPDSTTTYTFHISQNNGACIDDGSVTIKAAEGPVFNMPEDTTICQGDEIKIRLKLVSGTVTSYKWTSSTSEEVLSISSMLDDTPASTTIYSLEATNGICEANNYDMTVNVNELPTISSIEKIDVKKVAVTAEGGQEPYTYAVDNAEYQNSNELSLKHYGAHTYYVQDNYGCIGTKVDTLSAPNIDIPTVVSPNGDGNNDVFTTADFALAYPDAKVSIFDRYGKCLAKYNASEGNWDGTYNGHKMPSTDYWYEISIDEIDKTYTGHFTLINDH